MNIPYNPQPVAVHPRTIERRKIATEMGIEKRRWSDDRTLVGRFMANICYAGDCIVWTSTINGSGYGVLNVDGVPRRAHRIAYELQNGPIPNGLAIDHVCRNRCCVNPAHLEAVTDKVNIHRGNGKAVWEARAAKTHCKYGHELTPGNVYLVGPEKRGRDCRTCRTIRKRQFNQERRKRHV